MSEAFFWEIINLFNWTESDSDLVMKNAVIELSKCSIEDIYKFQDILSEKLFHLDKKVYAQNIGEASFKENEYFSSDMFLYVRACVVANGKETYEFVLANPTEMPKDIDFEDILFLAEKAYNLKTGKNDFNYIPKKSFETFSNQQGWDLSSPNFITNLLSACYVIIFFIISNTYLQNQ